MKIKSYILSHITPLHLNKTQPRAFAGNWNLPLQLKRYFEYFNNLIQLWNLYPWDIVAWNFFLLTFNLFTTSINNGFENQIKILYSHKINRLWCVVNAVKAYWFCERIGFDVLSMQFFGALMCCQCNFLEDCL